MARREVPQITRSAEAAADRVAAHPLTLINPVYSVSPGFTEELIARAGGLANAWPTQLRPDEATPHDVVLVGVRSWETDGEKVLPALQEAKAKGWLTIVFASAAGRPDDLPADFLIDNGARSGSQREAAVNAVTNTLNSWVWSCEYLAAMTRHGKCPGVLLSISYAEAMTYDVPLQTSPGGRQWLGECRHAVAPGALAAVYLRRAERLADALASERTQGQVQEAAQIIAERMAAGRKVAVSGIGHLVLYEWSSDTRAPWKPFNSVFLAEKAFKENLREGDLLLWIGYIGMNSATDDYAKHIRESKADLIVSASPDPDPSRNGPWALAHVDQSWELGDAEVPIPCPPGRMAPISGVNAVLLFRMLDDEVSARLATMPTTAPATTGPSTQP